MDSIKPRELIVLGGWSDENDPWWSYLKQVYLTNSIRARINPAFGESGLILCSGFQMLGTNLRFLSLDFTVRTSHLEVLNLFARLEELNIGEVNASILINIISQP